MRSLTARLVASHLFVIGLTLGLVLVLSSTLVRRYETDVQEARLNEIAVPLTLAATVFSSDRRGGQPRTGGLVSLDVQAQALDVRLLVFDPEGTVVYDTERNENLTGQTLGDLSAQATNLRNDALGLRSGIQKETVTGSGDGPLSGESIVLTATGRSEDDFVLAVVSSQDRFPLLREFLRPILFVTGIALLLASIAGYLLSRRIAAPIVELTSAANAMAEGNLQQHVPAAGTDEIGRLVAAFNTMSTAVADTAESQKNLLANVAHELRTPLTSIRGYAQALADGVVDEPMQQRRALQTIQTETVRMQQLIEQLLELARFEAGQNQLVLEDVPLDPVLESCRQRFATIAAERNVTLATITNTSPCVRIDQAQFERAIDNIVSNAIRHSPSGSNVTITAAATGSNRVEIQIFDHGDGIPAEELPFVFDRFRRGGHGDVGLGLAIAREIVTLHGGEIAIDSVVGAGTTVTIRTPGCPAPTRSAAQVW